MSGFFETVSLRMSHVSFYSLCIGKATWSVQDFAYFMSLHYIYKNPPVRHVSLRVDFQDRIRSYALTR